MEMSPGITPVMENSPKHLLHVLMALSKAHPSSGLLAWKGFPKLVPFVRSQQGGWVWELDELLLWEWDQL